jgi:hypothetical protein
MIPTLILPRTKKIYEIHVYEKGYVILWDSGEQRCWLFGGSRYASIDELLQHCVEICPVTKKTVEEFYDKKLEEALELYAK